MSISCLKLNYLSTVIPQTIINELLAGTVPLKNHLPEPFQQKNKENISAAFNYSRRLLHTHACLRYSLHKNGNFSNKKINIALKETKIYIFAKPKPQLKPSGLTELVLIPIPPAADRLTGWPTIRNSTFKLNYSQIFIGKFVLLQYKTYNPSSDLSSISFKPIHSAIN